MGLKKEHSALSEGYDMSGLNSLSLFVGVGQCNANCAHCAGKPLRRYAPKEDGIVDEGLIIMTLRECFDQGARYLSISSSGEPTLSPQSVTRTLELVSQCGREGKQYSPINLYSNGIRIGQEEGFCKKYLQYWRNLGLTTLHVTVHDIDEKRNAEVYSVAQYPPLDSVISRIHYADLKVRANLVLSRKTICNLDAFKRTAEHLIMLGADKISAWPLRDLEDRLDTENSPAADELESMEHWAEERYPGKVRVLLEKTKIAYSTGEKLTLFQTGKLSNNWCNR